MARENPFIVQREISYGEPFCDRAAEIRTILESAHRGEAVCLLSPRRYGKSSLVNQVAGHLREQEGWITLRVDLMEVFSIQDLARELESRRVSALGALEQLKAKAKETLSRLKAQAAIDPVSGLPSFSLEIGGTVSAEEALLRTVLRNIAAMAELAETPVCLVLDEFQEVAALDSKKRIEGVFRGVFQKRPPGFVPIYLGSRRHMLKLMFEDSSAPFYRSARMLELATLPPGEFSSFMVEQFKETLGLDLAKEVASTTARLFGGHPYALNKVASYLWTRCSLEKLSDPAGIKKVWRKVVTEFIHEERNYYKFSNKDIPRYAMRVLLRVAQEGVVKEPYSAAFSKSCGLTPGQIQNALKILFREDKLAEGEHGLSVEDPLERVCLQVMRRSVWEDFEIGELDQAPDEG